MPRYTGIVGPFCEDRDVYPRETVDTALLLSSLDVLDRENAQICGVSIRALRHWRYGNRRDPRAARKRREPRCPRCDGRPLDEPAYAYLLGLYLGDGHITHVRRVSYALNVKCCDDWPGLIVAAETAMAAVIPTSSVCRVQRTGCTEVKSTSKHWPCLFPQHGPGRKHDRTIELAPWQQRRSYANVPRALRPRIVSLRWLPGNEPGPATAGQRGPLVRISALLVLQRINRHPRAMRAGPRPARGQLADVPPQTCAVGGAAGGGGAAG